MKKVSSITALKNLLKGTAGATVGATSELAKGTIREHAKGKESQRDINRRSRARLFEDILNEGEDS